jgi:hypothetical protein
MAAAGLLGALAASGAPATPVGGDETVTVPSFFEARTSAAGTSYTQFKSPNPLPVGPGAFFVAESPEAAGELSLSSGQARGSVFYPGPLFSGLPSLLCLAGVSPACDVSGFPTVAQAQHPGTPDARVVTDPMQYKDPASPVHFGVGEGVAHATDALDGGVASHGRVGGWAVLPPSPAYDVILQALQATLGSIPGAKITPDPALVSVGSSTASERIVAVDGGAIRTEATAVIEDVRMLTGAVTIDSIVVTAAAVTDGEKVSKAVSSVRYGGVFVAGFPATIGPDGILLTGQGSKDAFSQLNGAASAVAQAFAAATGKLRMELRSGTAEAHQTPGAPHSSADGLLLTFGSSPLTDTSPPQPPAELCAPINEAIGSLPPDFPRPPPICGVPDLTGTDDSYQVRLGRAAVLVEAQSFGDGGIDLDLGLDDLGTVAGSGDDGEFRGDGALDDFAGSGDDAVVDDTSSLPEVASGPVEPGPSLAGARLARFGETFAGVDLWQLYMAIALLSIGLASSSKLLIRQLSGSRPGGGRAKP